ncbi:hypothetical protein JTB14_034728 [Gonioctena quinquepunctata]|nr:hypothetical protein JTB14_034728 [Gonioctena quinquepunctata]
MNKKKITVVGSSNEEIPSDSEAPTKKKQKIFEQKFRDEWKQSRSWLENREGSSYCILCKKALSGGIVHINRHESTKFHIKRMNATNMSNKIEKVFQSDAVESDRNVKKTELQLAMLIAIQNFRTSTKVNKKSIS